MGGGGGGWGCKFCMPYYYKQLTYERNNGDVNLLPGASIDMRAKWHRGAIFACKHGILWHFVWFFTV